MTKEKCRNNSPPLLLTTLVVAVAVLSSLSVSVLSANSAAAENQITNKTNATTSEAARNATTSAQNATASAGQAAAAAGNALGNASKAAGGVIGNAISNATSSLNKVVNMSSITVTPNSVNAGDLVVIKGFGFSANDTITLKFDNNSIATTKSDNTGALNAMMTTPKDATNGSHDITATGGNGRSAKASVTIIALPPSAAPSSSSSSNSSSRTG